MLTGQSILCFAPGPWHDLWRNRHQIMSRLARGNTVLWVEPRLSLRATWRQRSRGLRWKPQPLERVRDGLHVFHNPALLPASGPAGIGAAANIMYRALLRRAMHSLGMVRPILWLYLPEMAGIIGQYGERLVVYHVVDEYAAYGGMPASYAPMMKALEERLLHKADAVIVTAPALLESRSKHNANVHLVPNAVDYEGFQRRLATAPLPQELSSLRRPVIGYVGAINDKVDYDLLAMTATAWPDWIFALVGPVDVRTPTDIAGLAALRRLPNVHFFGPVAVEDVPLYIGACQVCLLPYKVNERTRNISALKLYEYLACGKPVVSTPIPAAAEGSGAVRVAPAASFAEAILESLGDEPQAVAQRKAVAAANTWDQRVETISTIINSLL